MSRMSELRGEGEDYLFPLNDLGTEVSLREDEQTCIQCGERVKRGGYWQGARSVSLCAHCAHDPAMLGALLADALLDSQWMRGCDYGQVMSRRKQALERFALAFWTATAGGETFLRTKKD